MRKRLTEKRGRPPKYRGTTMVAISLHLPPQTIDRLKALAAEAELTIDEKRTGYSSLATQVLIEFAERRRVVFDEFDFEPIKKRVE
jgi:hypothetical protein